jgi:Tol biopolymer transport system component/serine/threonine protein kinase/DNA-binding SARP family transcriptional activator
VFGLIELGTLGTIDLKDANGRELHSLLAQPKRLALLTFLCVAKPHGFHRRDKLLGLFWPDADQEHARLSLRNALHVLRRTLGEKVLQVRGDEEISVDFATVSCDANTFERAVSDGRYLEAIDSYRGDFLPGFFISECPEFERWLDEQRDVLRRAAARAGQLAAESLEAAGNVTAAVSLARKALELSDDDERVLRRLMLLLDQAGDRAGALRAYTAFAERLAKDFQGKPSSETEALINGLRMHAQNAPASTPGSGTTPGLLARENGAGSSAEVSGYRIEKELGKGSMATVYLAMDLKHQRRVALKILRPEVVATIGKERFLSEISICSHLRHPRILPLFDSGETGGLPFFSMPPIGETLRTRLDRERQLPIDEAIRLALEIGEALQYAHSQGIVHRDVKPENILLEDGHALVSDFGIARAIDSTEARRITHKGVALGSPSYMSPEQSEDNYALDPRTDVYSLGCVVYEMLAGDPPFIGSSARVIFARKSAEPAPSLRVVRETVPAALEEAVLKALARSPSDRFRSVAEFTAALRAAEERLAEAPHESQSRSATSIFHRRSVVPKIQHGARWDRRLLAGGAAMGLVLSGILVGIRYIRGNQPDFEVVGPTEQITNEPGLEITPALSPDGRFIAYAGGQPAYTTLFVQQIKGGQPIRLVGGPRAPQWSPDGSRLLYVDSVGLATMPAFGGSVQRLSTPDGLIPIGPVWSHDGRSLAYAAGGAIWVANADGTLAHKILNSNDPHSISWSPDDAKLAFANGNSVFIYGLDQFGNIAPSSIWIIARNGENAIRITDDTHANLSPIWSPDGHGVFYVSNIRGGRDVYYQPLRANTAAGAPRRVTTGLRIYGIAGRGETVAYSVWNTNVEIWSFPFPRSGAVSFSKVAARQISSASDRIEALRISPDGKWLAFDSDRSGNMDIYKMRVDGSDLQQLTRNTADEFHPGWSPDGRQVSFQSWRSGNRDSYVMSADGTSERLIAGAPSHDFAGMWSPDGTQIAFASDRNGGVSGSELFLVSASGGTPKQLTTQGGLWPYWSPDGKLIAYVGGAALRIITPQGRNERVIVSPSLLGAVTAIGGWSADSRTIYFRIRANDGNLNIARVSVDGRNPEVFVRFDDPQRRPYRSDFAIDGKHIYVTIGKHEADIWTMDLRKK